MSAIVDLHSLGAITAPAAIGSLALLVLGLVVGTRSIAWAWGFLALRVEAWGPVMSVASS